MVRRAPDVLPVPRAGVRTWRFALSLSLVTFPGPQLMAQATAPPLPVERDLVIDGHRHNLSFIRAVTVREDGVIVVTQPDDGTLLFFNPSGALLGQFGRSGAGPGEMRWPQEMWAVEDTVWFVDGPLRRVTGIRPDRTLLTTVVVPAIVGGAARGPSLIGSVAVARTRAGDWLLQGSLPPGSPLSDAGTLVAGVIRTDAEGRFKNVVGTLPSDCIQQTRHGAHHTPACRRPMSAQVGDGSLWVAAIPEVEAANRAAVLVVGIRATGDTAFVRRLMVTPQVITRTEADSIREGLVRVAEGARDVAMARAVVLKPIHPPLDWLVVGRNGDTWVGLRPIKGARRWIGLDSTGRDLGSVSLPAAVRLRYTNGTALYGTEEDDDGVESVVRYRVSGSSAR